MLVLYEMYNSIQFGSVEDKSTTTHVTCRSHVIPTHIKTLDASHVHLKKIQFIQFISIYTHCTLVCNTRRVLTIHVCRLYTSYQHTHTHVLYTRNLDTSHVHFTHVITQTVFFPHASLIHAVSGRINSQSFTNRSYPHTNHA